MTAAAIAVLCLDVYSSGVGLLGRGEARDVLGCGGGFEVLVGCGGRVFVLSIPRTSWFDDDVVPLIRETEISEMGDLMGSGEGASSLCIGREKLVVVGLFAGQGQGCFVPAISRSYMGGDPKRQSTVDPPQTQTASGWSWSSQIAAVGVGLTGGLGCGCRAVPGSR